jgi:hypothetical protein
VADVGARDAPGAGSYARSVGDAREDIGPIPPRTSTQGGAVRRATRRSAGRKSSIGLRQTEYRVGTPWLQVYQRSASESFDVLSAVQTAQQPGSDHLFDWSHQALAESLYYPAAYTDFSPLYRFSHLVRRYILADYAATPEVVAEALHREPRLRCVAEVDRPAILESLRALTPEGSPIKANEECWRSRSQMQPWARGFVVERRVGSQVRTLELLYVGGEAFLAYHELYGRRAVAPRILCTVNSGADEGGAWTRLEEYSGPFDRFVLTYPATPYFHVRGAYNAWYAWWGGHGWPDKAMRFRAWGGCEVAMYAQTRPTLPNRVDLVGANRRVTLLRRQLVPKDFLGSSPVFVNERMAQGMFKGMDRPPALHVFPETSTWHDVLRLVDETCASDGFESAVTAVVPYGDEGQLLREWLDQPGNPIHLEVRFVDMFDLADLRRDPP